MPRRACVIVNPSAGGGRAEKRLPAVEAALRAHGVPFRIQRTESLVHAHELAREAIAEGEVAAAMGGDGVVGAIAHVLRGTDGVLGVLPGGRGNDFARKLGIRDIEHACEVIATGAERRVDVADADGATYLGIASAGIDSDVQVIANSTRLKQLGDLVYVYGTLRALRGWRPCRWQVTIDGEHHEFSGYSVAVANSGVFGGGMFLVPGAELDDGILEVVLTEHVPKRRYLRNIPKVFKGTHLDEPGLRILPGRVVRFEADRPFSVFADGDPIAELPATITVVPGALRVLAP